MTLKDVLFFIQFFLISFLILGAVVTLRLTWVACEKQEEKCSAQYEQSKAEGKNLLDYECAKRLGPQIQTLFVPMGIR